MDLVIENVGRRSRQWGNQGDPTDVGDYSLNGRERNALFWNRGDGRFVDVGFVAGADRIEDGRGVAVADFDQDGRLDLVVQNLDQPAVLLMGKGEVGRWLQLALEGAGPNRDAVGAVVRVHAGDLTVSRQVSAGSGFLASSSPVLHFGLGEARRIDRIEIRWPSGRRETLEGVATGQRLRLQEGRLDPLRRASSGP